MSKRDEYEARIASLRTGIKMVIDGLSPSLLSAEQRVDLASRSLQVLLDSDLDRALAGGA